MLREHIELLLDRDPGFIKYWDRCSPRERENFLKGALAIEKAGCQADTPHRFEHAHSLLRRLFAVIPELDLVESRITRDWLAFAMDDKEKQAVYKEAESSFRHYLEQYELTTMVALYGGLKEVQAIISKTVEREPMKLADLWDVVRFRMVAPSIREVLVIGLRIMDEFETRLLQCRNYYRRPKIEDPLHPYRALHFQILTGRRMVELQVMTKNQEVVSYLDHAIAFKRFVLPLSVAHNNWLDCVRLGALIVDHQTIPRTMCSPADLIAEW